MRPVGTGARLKDGFGETGLRVVPGDRQGGSGQGVQAGEAGSMCRLLHGQIGGPSLCACPRHETRGGLRQRVLGVSQQRTDSNLIFAVGMTGVQERILSREMLSSAQ